MKPTLTYKKQNVKTIEIRIKKLLFMMKEKECYVSPIFTHFCDTF